MTVLLLAMPGQVFAQALGADGPDFWSVTGLRPDASLNVRAGPAISSPVVMQISAGTILANLGCQGEGTTRWCQVQSPDGMAIKGWVSGRYLSESGPPQPVDALVAGTPYNARGQLPCKLAQAPEITACPFGVIRARTGLASIFITLPGNDERLIEFRDGAPVAPPGTTMTASKSQDMTTVTLGDGAEVYTIADVVFLGD